MSSSTSSAPVYAYRRFSPWQWLKDYLNQVEITNPKTARLICRLIPASCPFARQIRLFGKTVLVIPPLCHFNPVYEEVMGLRFRALTLLSDNSYQVSVISYGGVLSTDGRSHSSNA
ncbi:MAG: Mo-dependent nitrogenase C-terminal domain-containing protein [Cyanobacteriota bacterium]|nr:Mo-dependent nitrogenase C-terminal domain-containing protein [Cyanobacteriota bacterium]